MNDPAPAPTDTDLTDAAEEVKRAAKVAYMSQESTKRGFGSNLGPDLQKEKDKEEAEELVEWIVPHYKDKLCIPHPDSFGDLETPMESIAATFGLHVEKLADSDMESITNATEDLTAWDGAMKESLVGNYLSPLRTQSANHGRIAKYLAARARDMRKIYVARRTKAKEIADKTVPALEAVGRIDADVFKWLMAGLIIVGTAGTGVAGFLTAGSASLNALGAGLIIGGTAGGAAAEDPPDDSVKIGEKDLDLGGDSVEEVLDNMWNALEKLEEVTKDLEDEVFYDLNAARSYLEEFTSRPPAPGNDIIPASPTIVGASREEITSDKGLHPFDDSDGGDDDDGGDGGDGDDGGNGGDGDGRGSYHGPGDRPDDFEGSWDQTGSTWTAPLIGRTPGG